MSSNEAILTETAEKLRKAISHLDYSYNKIQTLPDSLSQMDEEILETWESFTARFSRVSDIFVMKYLRSRILIEEPGFEGSTRDYLNKAEKFNLIDSAETWVTIRELRNVAAHEYNDEDLSAFYAKIRSLCPLLLSIKEIL